MRSSPAAIHDSATVHGMVEDCRAAGRHVACGHHMAEEAPSELAEELLGFLAER